MATLNEAMAGKELKAEDDKYEFEDPIECWIDLCEAARILNENTRRNQMGALLFKAKNSHWTHELMEAQMIQEAEDADEDVDYAGNDTEPYEDDQSEQPGGDYEPM